MISILDVVGPFSDTIRDDLKELFKNFLDKKDGDEGSNIKINDECEFSDEESKKEETKDLDDLKGKKGKLTSEIDYLINCDDIIGDKIDYKKKKSVKIINNNLLDDLAYNGS